MPLISILINGQQPPSVAMPAQVGMVSTVLNSKKIPIWYGYLLRLCKKQDKQSSLDPVSYFLIVALSLFITA
jgi:hypothetical protein